MTPETTLLSSHRPALLRIARKHGAHNVRIFGSVARNKADKDRDIGFLVDMEPGHNLFDPGGLLMDLQELLHCKVDVTVKCLRQCIRISVLKEAIPL